MAAFRLASATAARTVATTATSAAGTTARTVATTATSAAGTTATSAGTTTRNSATTQRGSGTTTRGTGTVARHGSAPATGHSGTNAAAGRWARPSTVLGPVDSDLIPAVLAVSASGAVAVGSGTTDEDAENLAQAAIITGGPGRRVAAPSELSDTQQALAVGYLGSRLIELGGTSPSGDACCSTASARSGVPGDLGPGQTLANGLEGTTLGALVPVRGGLLAALDNQGGIVVARSDSEGDFSAPETLAPNDPTPPLMAVASLSDGGAVVAWTAPVTSAQTVTGTTTAPGSSSTASGYDQPANQLIYFAGANATGLPGAARLAVRVPNGREIEALTVAPHGSGATIAWTESWFAGAAYRSEVFWADLATAARVHTLSGPASVAVDLSMASAGAGRQVLAWQACDVSAGTCTADAALRPHGEGWGPVQTLGSVDPDSFPVATQSSRGQTLVGWVANGFVQASAAAPGADAFSAAVKLPGSGDDSDLALSFGAGRRAAAVWTQGTVDQRLLLSRFTP